MFDRLNQYVIITERTDALKSIIQREDLLVRHSDLLE
jgi:hypothetical protein